MLRSGLALTFVLFISAADADESGECHFIGASKTFQEAFNRQAEAFADAINLTDACHSGCCFFKWTLKTGKGLITNIGYVTDEALDQSGINQSIFSSARIGKFLFERSSSYNDPDYTSAFTFYITQDSTKEKAEAACLAEQKETLSDKILKAMAKLPDTCTTY